MTPHRTFLYSFEVSSSDVKSFIVHARVESYVFRLPEEPNLERVWISRASLYWDLGLLKTRRHCSKCQICIGLMRQSHTDWLQDQRSFGSNLNRLNDRLIRADRYDDRSNRNKHWVLSFIHEVFEQYTPQAKRHFYYGDLVGTGGSARRMSSSS